jgi:hypothetical protein
MSKTSVIRRTTTPEQVEELLRAEIHDVIAEVHDRWGVGHMGPRSEKWWLLQDMALRLTIKQAAGAAKVTVSEANFVELARNEYLAATDDKMKRFKEFGDYRRMPSNF